MVPSATTWSPSAGLGPAPAAATAVAAGRLIIGRYRALTRLGAGGFGEVWSAEDTVTGREVAVKRLPLSAGSGLRRIRRELAALRHARVPGVVRLLDDAIEAEDAWIVMERLRGGPFLAGVGAWEAVADEVRELMRTLAAVHRTGIVHGDLKPGNIVHVPGRGPVLVDFGIARGRALDADGVGDGFTRPYVAPEVLAGRPPGPLADLFAIGVMLWEYLCGERFDAWGPDERPALATFAPLAPPSVVALVERLVLPRPEGRPADALEVLRGLGGGEGAPEHLTRALPDPAPVELLQGLFCGPSRLLHLPCDAARELARRTEGGHAAVRAELEGWVALGLGRWQDGRVAVARRALERLAAGLVVVHPPEDGGGVAARLLAAESGPEDVQAVLAEVRRLRHEGRLEGALALVELALDVVPTGAVGDTDGLLTELVLLALGLNTSDAAERALYELERRAARSGLHEALWALMRAGARMISGRRSEVGPLLDGVPELEDDDLEGWRVFLLVHGREVGALADAESALLDVAAWAARSPLRQVRWQGWLGNVRYQQGRCEEAALLHEEALEARERLGAPMEYRLASRTMAATTWLDAGRLDRAWELAQAAERDAAALRSVVFECHAAWVSRCVQARRGEAEAPDDELVEAAFAVSRPSGAQMAAVEAVVAWRSGRVGTCIELLDRAVEVLRERGHAGSRLVLEALRWALVDRSTAVAERILAEVAASRVPPGLRVQALGLVAAGRPDLAEAVAGPLFAASHQLGRVDRRLPREVISVDEALGVQDPGRGRPRRGGLPGRPGPLAPTVTDRPPG